jgi:hypothetical protein
MRLPGFVLLAVSHLGSEIEYAIETSEAVAGCPTCGVLSERGWDRLLAVVTAGDVDQQIALTWIAAQDLRAIFGCRSR